MTEATATAPNGAAPEAGEAPAAESTAQAQVEAQPAPLPEAPPAVVPSGGGAIDVLLDSVLPVTVSLGSAMMPVGELLQLGEGSVIKLDRKVGQPVDVILRGVKIACGHLVVVGEQLGIRVHEVIPRAQAEEAAS